MSEMQRECMWLGIDLAKRTLVASLAPQTARQWRKLRTDSFAHDAQGVAQLAAWVRRALGAGGVCAGVVVEATGRLGERFRALWSEQMPDVAVSVCNPAQIAAFIASQGVRDKRDASDAALIALFAAQRRPRPTPVPEPGPARLRELDRLREQMIGDRTRWRNRLHDALDALARQRIEAMLEHLEQELTKLEQQLRETVGADAGLARQVKLLESVPGIGPVVARTLLAELGDLTATARDQLVARAGLYPLAEESGSSLRRRPRLAKGGGGRVRRALYMAVTSLWRVKRGAVWEVGRKLTQRGRPNMVAIGAMMRKLLLIARAVLVSDREYDAAQAQRATGLRRDPKARDGFVAAGKILDEMLCAP